MNKRLRSALQQDISRRTFWVLVVLVVLVKLVMTRFQMVYVWVGGAPLDDELMFGAAQSITAGQWLGAYDWLTLSKHMFFAVWLALCSLLHLPYLAAGQLLTCSAALACAFAFAPVLRRWKSRFAVFALLAFSPAATASFTLRVYRDNIFPGLCMLFFAGLCGYALRCRRPVKQGIGWLVLSGVGLGLAWLTREDGIWLLPFAAAGTLILIVTALRDKGALPKKLGRCALLAVPYGLLAAAILAYSAVNYAYYGLFAVSDFSSGSFAAAVGAMSRVKAEEWKPLCSVPTDVRMKLYDAVPQLQPLEYWLEEDEDLQNSFRNPELDDYQSGSFYWALRKAAWNEGVYDSPQKAAEYWQQVADAINALCDSGQLEANGPERSSTTPPIRMEYVPDVLAEGVRSLLHTLTFRDCAPYYADQRSLILPEDEAVYEAYLGQQVNSAAQAGSDLPYYSPLQKLVYTGMEVIRLVYAVGLPVLFVAAVVLQARRGIQLLQLRKQKAIQPGQALLWVLLLGLLGMALLRCFMIAFVEVASFNIGTSTMYLSTVHPLLLLYSGAGILTLWRKNQWQTS
ncbi:hypothetical protein [Allofournierella sp. CML151]|uniref:hypothetical protein n=1 Tax=Allofournierella sp. CML151 TaxID=2998082 RepID=UPI0022EA2EC3|nr:hypothetical protein [Fournierella sp. CML151]